MHRYIAPYTEAVATAVLHPAPTASAVSRSPLALWHLLSLDAPSVAAVWTLFFARSYGVQCSMGVPLVLALAVWVMYAADRINDSRHTGILMERHRFHMQHWRWFAVAMLFAVPLLVALTAALPHGIRNIWLLLSLPMLVYFFVVHGLRLRLPKEAMVGIFFGLATATPVVASGSVPWHHSLPSVLLFGLLCWLNGIAIARWEGAPRCTTDACTAWLAQHTSGVGTALVVGGLLLWPWPQCRMVASTVVLSAGLLYLIERIRARLDAVHVRALADAALLTPLAVWPLHRWLMPR